MEKKISTLDFFIDTFEPFRAQAFSSESKFT